MSTTASDGRSSDGTPPGPAAERSTRELLESSARRAIYYLERLDERRVAPSAEAVAAVERFDEAMPDVGSDPEATLELLDQVGSPATLAMAGPRFDRSAALG